MALTKEQWFQKLKSWVPPWVFEREEYNKAVFMAGARLLSEAEGEAERLHAQTMILTADSEHLALHGSERSVERLDGESIESYRHRVRHIESTISEPTLFELVKALLTNGEPIFFENWQQGFSDSDFFADCDDSVATSKAKNYNRFTVIIPVQESNFEFIKSAVVRVLDDNKAWGVLYDVHFKFFVLITGEGDEIPTYEDGGMILGEGA